MLSALALASSLWLAASEAGARAEELHRRSGSVRDPACSAAFAPSPSPVETFSRSEEPCPSERYAAGRQGLPVQPPDTTLPLWLFQDAVVAPVVPVEKVADAFARDMYWLIGSHAADLYSTAWAIHRCQTCFESNRLGPSSEARIALKMAGVASTGLTLFKLRRSGHGRAADVLRWAHVAVNIALATNNAVHAIRKK